MGNTNQNLMAEDGSNDIAPSEAESLRRDQEKHHRASGAKRAVFLLNDTILNEEAIEGEMEDLSREEENRGTVRAA
jgi:hypothetical protein